MTLEGQIGAPKKLGVRLANTRGRPLGWLERPKLRSDLLVVWNGRLNGKQLPDGYYEAQLVAGGVVVARTLFRTTRSRRCSRTSASRTAAGRSAATLRC